MVLHPGAELRRAREIVAMARKVAEDAGAGALQPDQLDAEAGRGAPVEPAGCRRWSWWSGQRRDARLQLPPRQLAYAEDTT